MKRAIIYMFKAVRQSGFTIVPFFSIIITKIYLHLNGVKFSSINCTGIPHVHVSLNGKCEIGENFSLTSWIGSSATGYSGKCRLDVRNGAVLKIGNNVGMSLATIVCHNKITIEDYVNIGVGVHIYDTDFHSLDSTLRQNPKTDWENKITKPILIEKNAFIGAQAIILKGVTIGANSIIGAGSVVTKNIPANVIAAGNPCRVLKNLNHENI
jgi:acetyltransferase-like isoleucine patch superfamily enzyme